MIAFTGYVEHNMPFCRMIVKLLLTMNAFQWVVFVWLFFVVQNLFCIFTLSSSTFCEYSHFDAINEPLN